MVLQIVIPEKKWQQQLKIAISIDTKVLNKIDKLVENKMFANRSRAILTAIEEKISKLDKSRLAIESAKLNIEEGSQTDFTEWPKY